MGHLPTFGVHSIQVGEGDTYLETAQEFQLELKITSEPVFANF